MIPRGSSISAERSVGGATPFPSANDSHGILRIIHTRKYTALLSLPDGTTGTTRIEYQWVAPAGGGVAFPTWTREELGKRTSMGCPLGPFFGRILLFFRRVPARGCRPPPVGWTALTYTASIVGLAEQHAGRPDLVRSPKRVLAQDWEGLLLS